MNDHIDHLKLRLFAKPGSFWMITVLNTTSIYSDRLDIVEWGGNGEGRCYHTIDIDCYNEGTQVGHHHVETHLPDALEPSIQIEYVTP